MASAILAAGAPRPIQMARAASHTKGREGKTVEEIYQKKTQLEHILLRPDTYVGSIEAQTQDLWVFDSVQSRMVQRKISFVPALYKIFDEILVNAADNLMRDPAGMDTIKVDIDVAKGSISVFNNGKGLPVVIHKEHHVYIPELVFGHLLTSDNYNDKDCKVVGGRNGYGAKLANVFSTEFIIETCDGAHSFTQVFSKNMMAKTVPVVASCREKPFTRVTFKPELSRFGMTTLDDDIVSLLTKRVYDIAGSTDEKCAVYLNNDKLEVKNFKDYTELYLLTRQGFPNIYSKVSDRWEVCFSLTEGGFQQVSFANSIATIRGGTHVTHVTDQIVEAILEKAKAASKEKQKGGCDIRPHHVRGHLWIFVKALIENPAFDSQTKETLTTKQSKFGSRCELSEEFMSQVSECGVVDLILMAAMAKSKVDLGKKLKANTGRVNRIAGIPKLEDANDAGGKASAECTLILTEGDSAKTLAVAGLSVVGRDRYGVFPLKGKVLNVRDATLKQMMSNDEIQNLIKIMGLDLNKEYDAELKGLRYGSIMIMTDQDADGSHIKGLLINLIHAWWPSLTKLPGFIKEFFTPIVKASKGKSQHCFYTMVEYETWKEATENGKGFKIKYYKGLGTSTSQEAKEYFSAIDAHKLAYKYEGKDDDGAIDLAFNKRRADDRKTWINEYVDGDLVDHTLSEVSYGDFINKELVLFSRANVIRAIPSLIDGFKPSQRKVLFGCFKRKLTKDVKVAQLVGYVVDNASYHHGENALQDTIIGMAQDFVGSNNVNLLVPQGQFGTRLEGGKDAAASRYIYTRLAPVTRAIFKEADDNILNYQNEEGLKIEPVWYCPIIPMVLINGADGIGTGYATSIPNFNPHDVIANLRRYLSMQRLEKMTPWFAGFKGGIEYSREEGKVEVTGRIHAHEGDSTRATITELPIRKWTQDYREFLEENLPRGQARGDKAKLLEDFEEHHTEKSIHFELRLSAAGAACRDLEKTFKLRSSLSINNMMLFDADGVIKKYDSPLDIIVDFAKVRLVFYQKRKEFLISRLTWESEVLTAKARFIKLVLSGDLVIKRRKINDLVEDLRRRGFKAFGDIKGNKVDEPQPNDGADEEDEEQGDGEDDGEGDTVPSKVSRQGVADFEYLVGMPISTLTAEKVDELLRQHDVKTRELETIIKKTPESMWIEDLDELERVLDERIRLAAKEEELERAKVQKAREAQKAKESRGTKRGTTGALPSAAKKKTAVFGTDGRGQKRKV